MTYLIYLPWVVFLLGLFWIVRQGVEGKRKEQEEKEMLKATSELMQSQLPGLAQEFKQELKSYLGQYGLRSYGRTMSLGRMGPKEQVPEIQGAEMAKKLLPN